MLPRNQRMELLSRAYVRAVAAHAGFTCDDVESDFGVDLAIRAVEWENVDITTLAWFWMCS